MSVLKFHPAVFAVGDEYQIMAVTECSTVFRVKVGDKYYYDHSNGILRSEVYAHRVSVPAEVLNDAGEYTVCVRRIIERKPYFSELSPWEDISYEFCAPSGDGIRAYHIADAHNFTDEPIAAARTYADKCGKIDFLILNGDVPEDSGNVKNIDNVYKIVSEITLGRIPVVFSRGNHDMRGVYAERFAENTPNYDGKSYYSFRIGNIWGLVMDSGEDKDDSSIEYGGVICCHEFREAETEYLQSVIANADNEYLACGVEHKIVIVHNPFTLIKSADIFDIEKELFAHWGKLLKDCVEPEVMICGHKHYLKTILPGDDADLYCTPCPVVIGSKIDVANKYFAGVGYCFGKEGTECVFTDNQGNILDEYGVLLKKK